MKPSACAFVGAIVIGSGWLSLPAVAADMRPGIAKISSQSNAITVASDAVSETCGEHARVHAPGCTCAHCSASSAK